MFEQFKKNKNTGFLPESFKISKPVEVIFHLNFDDKGAYLEVTDKKNNPIYPDYRQYQGVVRSILKSVELIKQKGDFAIDWENPENRIYLFEHTYLLEPLLTIRAICKPERTANNS